MGNRAQLSTDFKKKYVKDLKGKKFVEYNGLLALAQDQDDFGHIEARITVYPSAENKFTTFARAEIFSKDGKRIGMEEADANVLNCNKMVGVHAPRMALTRAKGRALRDYLGIDMVTKEEIMLYEPDLADPKSIGKIKRLAKDGRINMEKVYDWLESQTGAEEFNELTQDQANEFIVYMEERIAKIQKRRADKKKAAVTEDDEYESKITGE